MIYNFVGTVRDDASVLRQAWVQGIHEATPEQWDRIKTAALRMLAIAGMAFGALLSINVITSLVIFPIKAAFKLAIPVSLFVFSHDFFIMSQNYSDPYFHQQERASLWHLLWGKQLPTKEAAERFSADTYLKPLWMWYYINQLNSRKG